MYDEENWQKSVTVGGTTTRYYYANGARVVMLDGARLKYLLGDHLGSTAITTNNTGARQTELRYFAYGKTRYTFGAPPTSFKYTGQRQQVNANEMYFYGARWYDALVGRFLSPDTIVPQPGNPQPLNRYTYSNNNPLRYTDPSGHCPTCAGAFVGAVVGGGLYLWNEGRQDGFDLRTDWLDFLAASGEGAIAGALIMTPGGQDAGIGMASNLIADHVENLALEQDFSVTEHLVTGMTGAFEGAVGAQVVSRVGKAARAAGVAGETLQGVKMIGQAASDAVWGAVDGGARAALNGQSVGKGALGGAVQNGLTGMLSFSAVESARAAGGIKTIGEARGVGLAHSYIPDGMVTFGRAIVHQANKGQRQLDSRRTRRGAACE